MKNIIIKNIAPSRAIKLETLYTRKRMLEETEKLTSIAKENSNYTIVIEGHETNQDIAEFVLYFPIEIPDFIAFYPEDFQILTREKMLTTIVKLEQIEEGLIYLRKYAHKKNINLKDKYRIEFTKKETFLFKNSKLNVELQIPII